MVNDLLEISRLEAGQLHLNYVSCDLSRLVRLLAANFDAVATEYRLTYQVHPLPHLRAEVDAAKIERVLHNRIASGQTRYIVGTGLGLAVVYEIVSLHGVCSLMTPLFRSTELRRYNLDFLASKTEASLIFSVSAMLQQR